MVADFRSQNVDLNKVSKHVKDYVANAAKQEGNKKKIDSEKELQMLGQYLSGSGFSLNKDEIGYIQGFMIEYQQTKEQQFVEDFVTDNTKNEVKKIMKRMGDKKTIDSDEEAQALAIMLRNSHNDLNAADIAYVRSLLIKSGYFQYLEEKEPGITVVNVIVNEEKNAEPNKSEGKEVNNITNETKPTYNYPVKNKKFPLKAQRNKNQETKEQAEEAKKEAERAKSEADRSAKEADRSAKEADRSKKEADRSKSEADRAKKEADSIKQSPKVSEKARTQGFGIANKIQEELHDFWTNNGTVENELNKVNSTNAYSFVGKMMAISDGHNAFGSFYKRVSASSVCHAVFSLLNQAKKIGLEKDNAYIKLEETYKFLRQQYQDKSPNDPVYDERDIQRLDIQVKHLYNVMSKVYK